MHRMRWLLTTIHVLVFLLALSIPVAIFNGTLFSWHPTLMSLAFLGFMTEGVTTAILFRSKDGNERVAAIQKHLIWQLLGFACLLGGFAAIYRNKVGHPLIRFSPGQPVCAILRYVVPTVQSTSIRTCCFIEGPMRAPRL